MRHKTILYYTCLTRILLYYLLYCCIYRRIKAKERELLMVRNLPHNDYTHYIRLRHDWCARRIQRLWRNSKYGYKYEINSNIPYKYPSYSHGAYNRHGVYIPKKPGLVYPHKSTPSYPPGGGSGGNTNRTTEDTYENVLLNEHKAMLYKKMSDDVAEARKIGPFPLPDYKAAIGLYIIYVV